MQLTLKNITHRYGKNIALDNINLTLTPGVYALLGPNGAGKSTMIKLITGILSPSDGEILFNQKNIKDFASEYRNLLGYMPQQQGLYETFTDARFLSYIGSLKGMSQNNAEKDIDILLATVNLSEYKHRKIVEMSGGMKQRLLLAQALMNSPNILILDEPTAGLDPRERIRIRNNIAQFALDKIVLLATHVVSDIEHLAKKIILLNKGQIIGKAEPPLELCRSLAGRVFEAIVTPNDLERLQSFYIIANVAETLEGLKIRLISETPPKCIKWKIVTPSLEDVYLYNFENIQSQ